MSETLKVNITLTELFLSGEEEKNEKKGERKEKTRDYQEMELEIKGQKH